MLRLLIASCALATVSGHGVLTKPISRALSIATNATDGLRFAGECPGGTACTWYNQYTMIPGKTTNCDKRMRTMGVNCGDKNPTDFPCTAGVAVPWCAPGSAPVKSPCGIFSGGWRSNGRDMRDLPGEPRATWAAGSVVEVAAAVTANHGGGWAYRLCRADSDLSEQCFQAGHLAFSGDVQRIVDPAGKVVAIAPAVRTSNGTWPRGSQWTRNPFPMEKGNIEPIPNLPQVYGRGPFNYSAVDQVVVPRGLAPGHYVLSWRWEAEQTKQVWAHCSDVLVTAAEGMGGADGAAQTRETRAMGPLPSGRKNVCTHDSLSLDVADCDAWVDLFDALGGATWLRSGGIACKGDLRTNPCGCNGYWQKDVRCTATRDLQRITEIYLLGANVRGHIPASIAKFDELVALSLVGTQLQGTLPPAIGTMKNLEMVWLDHNPSLGGPIPESFTGLTKLTAFELHRSNFSGRLPPMAYAGIADCTLNDLTFDCPLPRGAETCGAACRVVV